MRLNVALQLKLPGYTGHATFSERIPSLDYNGRTVSFAGPVSVDVSYVYDGTSFVVSGSFDSELLSECARCSTEFHEPFSFDFSERFARSVSDDEAGEIYPYSGDFIDIDTMICDNILLNLPISSVCKDDCLGKCPKCGCNLNKTQCSCVPDEDEKPVSNEVYFPFAGLMDLLTDNEEEV